MRLHAHQPRWVGVLRCARQKINLKVECRGSWVSSPPPSCAADVLPTSLLGCFRSKRYTRDRAVIMMHRYFTSVSSATCTGLDKWVSSSSW